MLSEEQHYFFPAACRMKGIGVQSPCFGSVPSNLNVSFFFNWFHRTRESFSIKPSLFACAGRIQSFQALLDPRSPTTKFEDRLRGSDDCGDFLRDHQNSSPDFGGMRCSSQ